MLGIILAGTILQTQIAPLDLKQTEARLLELLNMENAYSQGVAYATSARDLGLEAEATKKQFEKWWHMSPRGPEHSVQHELIVSILEGIAIEFKDHGEDPNDTQKLKALDHERIALFQKELDEEEERLRSARKPSE